MDLGGGRLRWKGGKRCTVSSIPSKIPGYSKESSQTVALAVDRKRTPRVTDSKGFHFTRCEACLTSPHDIRAGVTNGSQHCDKQSSSRDTPTTEKGFQIDSLSMSCSLADWALAAITVSSGHKCISPVAVAAADHTCKWSGITHPHRIQSAF